MQTYKMSKEIIMFGDSEIEKLNFQWYKNPNYDVNIDWVVVSNKVSFGRKDFKCFIVYKNHYEKVLPLCIMFIKCI